MISTYRHRRTPDTIVQAVQVNNRRNDNEFSVMTNNSFSRRYVRAVGRIPDERQK